MLLDAVATLYDVPPSVGLDDAPATIKVALAVTLISAAVLLLVGRARRRK